MKFEVWYSIEPNFHEPTYPLTVGELCSDYGYVCTRNAEHPDEVFTQMQAENWRPVKEQIAALKRAGVNHASMSVGDILKVGDVLYQVKFAGWRRIQLARVYEDPSLDFHTHEEEVGEDRELWDPGDDEAPFWENEW